MPRLGCAVIGAGSWGSLIAHQMSQSLSFELLGIVDNSAERARALADELQTNGFDNTDAILSDPKIQAVAIAVPNALHFSLAITVLNAEKHLFIEKPMTLTVAEADAIVELASNKDLVVVPDHIQRLFPLLVKVKQMIDTGLLGDIVAVSVSRRDLLIRTKAWLQKREMVGGVLYQSAVHEYDFLRWFFGDVAEISCIAGRQVSLDQEIDYPDTILTQLRFQSGVVGQIWNCMSDPLMGYEGVVTGTEGTVWFNLYTGVLQWRKLGEKECEITWNPPDQWSAPAAYEKGTQPIGEIKALAGLIDNFANAIQGLEKPIVTGEDGARSIEIAQAGYLSLSKRGPVSIPLDASDRSRKTYMEVGFQC
jgi:predicted dehydrogenase